MPNITCYGSQITCDIPPGSWRDAVAKVLTAALPIEIVWLMFEFLPQDYIYSSFIRRCNRDMDIDDIYIQFTHQYMFITISSEDTVEKHVEAIDLRTQARTYFSCNSPWYAYSETRCDEYLAKLYDDISEFASGAPEIPSIESPSTPEILQCIKDKHHPIVCSTQRLCVIDLCGKIHLFYHKN